MVRVDRQSGPHRCLPGRYLLKDEASGSSPGDSTGRVSGSFGCEAFFGEEVKEQGGRHMRRGRVPTGGLFRPVARRRRVR